MRYFIYQGSEHDCGFASLKMLLATLAKDKSYLYISKPDKKERFNLKDIEEIADSFNVKLETSRCDDEYLKKMKCPCLALINTNHIVMIKKRILNYLIIYDPGEGIRIESIKKFKNTFSQIVIEVNDGSRIAKISKIRRNILPTKTSLTQCALSLISSALLIAGFYYLNDVENFRYSVIFLLLFCTSQFLESFYLFKQLNYFDKHYIPLYFNDDENKNKNKYIEYLTFKRNYFSSNRGLLSSVLIAFTILFLLCFNDFRNVLALIILILIKLLELVLTSKQNIHMFDKVETLERDSYEKPDKMIEYLLLANSLSSKKVFFDSLKNLFYMVICFSLAIAIMFITGNSGCNFVIFHFVIYFVGYRSFADILENAANEKTRYQKECEFLDNCNL